MEPINQSNQPVQAEAENTNQAPAANVPYYSAPYGGGYYYAPPYFVPPQAPKKAKAKLPKGWIVFICVVGLLLVFSFGALTTTLILHGIGSSAVGGEDEKSISDEFDTLDDHALTPGVDSGNNDADLQLASVKGKTLTTAQIAKKGEQSVLGISVYSTDGILEGEASGIVAGENSAHTKTYFITCAHVIAEDEDAVFKIVDNRGKEYLAAVIGFDESCDIGVLSVEKTGFTPAVFGDSAALSAGETVVAMGNPGGSEFYGSVTQGIVSATDRMLVTDDTSISCIQHDAAINPGSSGGALFNMYGQVVGINYSKIVTQYYEGMSFAVPSATAIRAANAIIAGGLRTKGAKLGITYYVAASYFDEDYKQLIIESVTDDSDLKGKVQKGDFIIAVNGEKITDKYTVLKVIGEKQAGDTITLTIASKNKSTGEYDTKDVTVKLVDK